MENWNIHDAEKLYRINDWGNGYFHISETGEVEVRLKDKSPQSSISLLSIAKGLQERGLKLPVLLRFSNILDDRIQHINESFLHAIQDANNNRLSRRSANTDSSTITDLRPAAKPNSS